MMPSMGAFECKECGSVIHKIIGRSGKWGVNGRCKCCNKKIASRRYRVANRERSRELARERYLVNGEHIRKLGKERRRKSGLNVKDCGVMFICPECGRQFEQTPGAGAIRKYCTSRCMQISANRRYQYSNREKLNKKSLEGMKLLYKKRRGLGLCVGCGGRLDGHTVCFCSSCKTKKDVYYGYL